ncbi:MAG TPA: hypothetical protein PKD64_19575 [Pirellulaceae bacterium]|nr:hypothetical protein [Pirellulaceae bacterium]HMO94393.1 hypothetical protein [Pirellulaceae bacterium]HMP71456.1 hypothetical protein [Pirellulaceae bacterium]
MLAQFSACCLDHFLDNPTLLTQFLHTLIPSARSKERHTLNWHGMCIDVLCHIDVGASLLLLIVVKLAREVVSRRSHWVALPLACDLAKAVLARLRPHLFLANCRSSQLASQEDEQTNLESCRELGDSARVANHLKQCDPLSVDGLEILLEA